jgi:hypothetical protein
LIFLSDILYRSADLDNDVLGIRFGSRNKHAFCLSQLENEHVDGWFRGCQYTIIFDGFENKDGLDCKPLYTLTFVGFMERFSGYAVMSPVCDYMRLNPVGYCL